MRRRKRASSTGGEGTTPSLVQSARIIASSCAGRLDEAATGATGDGAAASVPERGAGEATERQAAPERQAARARVKRCIEDDLPTSTTPPQSRVFPCGGARGVNAGRALPSLPARR